MSWIIVHETSEPISAAVVGEFAPVIRDKPVEWIRPGELRALVDISLMQFPFLIFAGEITAVPTSRTASQIISTRRRVIRALLPIAEELQEWMVMLLDIYRYFPRANYHKK